MSEMTSFDVLIVKIGAGVLAVEKRKNPKKLTTRVTLYALARAEAQGGGEQKPLKLCTEVGVPDIITLAKFSEHWFTGFGGAWVELFPVSVDCIDFRCRP